MWVRAPDEDTASRPVENKRDPASFKSHRLDMRRTRSFQRLRTGSRFVISSRFVDPRLRLLDRRVKAAGEAALD